MQLKLVSLLGLMVFIGMAWGISANRKCFPWRAVLWGLALQFVFAGRDFFEQNFNHEAHCNAARFAKQEWHLDVDGPVGTARTEVDLHGHPDHRIGHLDHLIALARPVLAPGSPAPARPSWSTSQATGRRSP